jgi:hypothetical protein
MGTEVLERQYTADELTSAMDQLHALSMATWRELLAHIAEYDRAEAWRADGMASMADWLIARYGLERSTALEWVRTARALTDLPAIADAVGAGRLSVDQTRWAIRVADPLRFIRPTGIPLPERPPPLAPDRREWLRKHLPHLGAIPRLAFEPG